MELATDTGRDLLDPIESSGGGSKPRSLFFLCAAASKDE